MEMLFDPDMMIASRSPSPIDYPYSYDALRNAQSDNAIHLPTLDTLLEVATNTADELVIDSDIVTTNNNDQLQPISDQSAWRFT